MARLGMALDLTHLDDRGFAEAAAAHPGPIYASHSNCRALVPSPRQLDDAQIDLIVERDGVIGIVLCNPMLAEDPAGPVGLDAVAAHIDHICQRSGDARHVAIGSDLDGGFGRESSPDGIDSIFDLTRIGPLLIDRGYATAEVEGVLGRNWYDFWRRVLPEA
jgi:membrane dipeptidase